MTRAPSTSQPVKRAVPKVLRWLGLFASFFAMGYAWGGPATSQRVASGIWAAGVFAALFAALFLLLTVIVRVKLGPLRKPIKQVQRELKAMDAVQLRTTAITAIETTGHFRSVPATRPPEPDWPQDVADFFSVYDSVEFVLPGTTGAYLCVCRSCVGDVKDNPDLLNIGEWYPPGSFIAVCRSSGRVVSWHTVTPPATTKRLLESDQLSQRSLWHYFALLAAQQHIADPVGKPVYTRVKKLDRRPDWRNQPESADAE